MIVRGALATLAVAAGSLLVVAGTPSYDPWAWLLWGREVLALELSTAEGPSFKPLPVAICALLAPLGTAAPTLWVLLARWGAIVAVVLAYTLGRDLGGGSRLAGAAAAVGVGLSAGYATYASQGSSEGPLLALILGAILLARAGRHRPALACVVAAALLRVEVWPLAAAYGLWLWWRAGGGERAALAALAVLVPALWLVPELLASGDVLRSGSRALQPNPGQPALAEFPAWASLRAAADVALWPTWIGLAAVAVVLGARAGRPAGRVASAAASVADTGHRVRARPRYRQAAALAAAGAAWVLLVAAMAEAGFSGEPRYSSTGVALIAIAAAAPLGDLAARIRLPAAPVSRALPIAAALVACLVVALAAAPRVAELERVREGQRHQAHLAADLRALVDAAGGRDALLACGRPYVGHYRGPLLAYGLDVEKRRVGFEPRPPGVVFASRRYPGAPVEPLTAGGFRPVLRNRSWTLLLGQPNRLPAPCSAADLARSPSPPAPEASS
ncbi:MAG: hypothetical protein GXY03_04315 [Solirubrobacterales bacterium]|nr:hypothetical protein [Solirubrobacterales bacterium]